MAHSVRMHLHLRTARPVVICMLAVAVCLATAGFKGRGTEVLRDPVVAARGIEVVAHRGGAAYGPENTLSLLEFALSRGYAVEADVRSTSDGVPILLHDPTLDRTTDCTGPAGSTSWTAMSVCDAAATWPSLKGTGVSVPRLEDLLHAVSLAASRGARVRLDLELKESEPQFLETVLRLIMRHELVQHTIISSFDPRLLRSITVEGLATAWLVAHVDERRLATETIPAAASVGIDRVQVQLGALGRQSMQAAMTHKVSLDVWTVNSTEALRRALLLGPARIITDYPACPRILTRGLSTDSPTTGSHGGIIPACTQ